MEPATAHLAQMATTSKHFARRLLAIGENRLELLMVEMQEERERLLYAILLTLGVAVFVFLAGVALTIAIVVLLWKISPVAVLLVLTGLYAVIALFIYRRFSALPRDWKTLPATLDQFRKDRTCLATILE
jgi:uncharacterized membrane protein YqjE